MQHLNRTFRDETIPLDGQVYNGCTFENCVFEYGGTKAVVFNANTIASSCRWRFTGAAGNALQYLEVMYHEFGDLGRDQVEATFEGIRSGSSLGLDRTG